MPIWVAYYIIVFGRVFASLSGSWFIVASSCGETSEFTHGNFVVDFTSFFFNTDWVTKFLSAKIFVLINKLSYAIYLLNPLLITLLFGHVEHGVNIDPVSMTLFTIGISVITTVLAIGFSLFFELPYYKLSSEILKKTRAVKKVE